MGFKERLREEIEYQGLLVKEVSAAVGISNSTFLSYIDARSVLPNVETAVKIAKFLGVTVEYLVDGEKPSKQLASKTRKAADNPEKNRLSQAYEKLSAHDKNVLLKIADAMSE